VPDKSTWQLVAAAAAAAVTLTAAGSVLVDHHAQTSVKKITGTTAETPGLAWSLDAAEYLGRPFGDFSDPRSGSSFSSGTPGFILADDTLVTIAGVPTEGFALDDAVMIGVDPGSGTVRWEAPATSLQQCSEEPLGGKIYCFTMDDGYELVTYDIESGETARRSLAQPVFGLTTTSDTLFIAEGSLEENDVRVHAGSFDDISANWSRSFDISGGWEQMYGLDILTVTDGVGLVQTGSEMAQFDAETGGELWSSGDTCVSGARLKSGGVVTQVNTDCESYEATISEQLLRGPDGEVLATAQSSARQGPMLEHPSDSDAPILLGDSAYDRATGERLWSNTDLVTGADGTLGTVTAVVGDIVYLRDTSKEVETETGIDIRTGKQLWHNTTAQHFNPTAADGSMVVGNDGIALTAFDISTGKVVWTAPFTAIDPDPETFFTGGATEHYDDGWIHSSDRRMIGLTPL